MVYIPSFGSGFQLSVNHPIDSRFEIDDISNADATYLATAYPGLITYDKATGTSFLIVSTGGTQATLVTTPLGSGGAATPVFDAANTYTDGERVLYMGLAYLRNSTARTAGTAFSHAHFDRVIAGGADLGQFVLGSAYLKDDVVSDGTVQYKANENMDSATPLTEGTSGQTWTRLTPKYLRTFDPDTIYIEGDHLYLEDVTYYVVTGFTSGNPAVLEDHPGDLHAISDDRRSKAPFYVDGMSFEANEILRYSQSVYIVNTGWIAELSPGIEADHNWEAIKGYLTLIVGPEESIPDFNAADTYEQNDKVKFQDFIWTRNGIARNPGDAFTIAHFDRDIPAGYHHDSYVEGNIYYAADTVTHDGIDYMINDFMLSAPALVEGDSGQTVTRLSSAYFLALEPSKRYVKGDVLVLDDGSFYVHTQFTTNDPASIDDHEANVKAMCTSEFPVYTDGDSIKAGRLIRYNGSLYFAPAAVDGTQPDSDTWAEVEPLLKLIATGQPDAVPFVQADTYAEGVTVLYKGMVWARNATVRAANALFSHAHFDRLEPAGYDHGEWELDMIYLVGDVVSNADGVKFTANDNIDQSLEFLEGNDPTHFTRISPSVFEAYENNKKYIKGDLFYMEGRSYLLKESFESTPTDTVDDHINKMMRISDDREILARTYTTGASFKTSELLLYNSGLYIVDAGWTAVTTPGSEAYHEWNAVNGRVTQLAQTQIITADPFDRTLAYSVGDLVEFENYIFETSVDHPADTDFTLAHFTRRVTGGEHRGAYNPNSHYLVGDIVEESGISYRVNYNVDYDSLGTRVIVEGLSGDTWLRVTTQTHLTYDVDKVYVVGDWILVNRQSFFVSKAFVGDSNALLEHDEVTLVSDDGYSFVAEYTENTDYDAGILFRHEGVVYIVHKDIDSTVTPIFSDIGDYIVKIAEPAKPDPVPFNKDDEYFELDRVTFNGDIYTKNDAGRPAGTEFSQIHFVREDAARHSASHDPAAFYADGDTVTVGNDDYRANSWIDGGTAFVEGVNTFEWTRITTNVFASLELEKPYLEGDIILDDRRTYKVTDDFTTDAVSTLPSTYPELVMINDDWTMLVPAFTTTVNFSTGELCRQNGNVYIATEDVAKDATDFDEAQWEHITNRPFKFGVFQADTLFKEGQVILENRRLYKAKAEFTSATTFDLADWEQIGGGDTGDWLPDTYYLKGEFVVTPDGRLGRAKVAFTSATDYDEANWELMGSETKIKVLSGTTELGTDFSELQFDLATAGLGVRKDPGNPKRVYIGPIANNADPLWSGFALNLIDGISPNNASVPYYIANDPSTSLSGAVGKLLTSPIFNGTCAREVGGFGNGSKVEVKVTKLEDSSEQIVEVETNAASVNNGGVTITLNGYGLDGDGVTYKCTSFAIEIDLDTIYGGVFVDGSYSLTLTYTSVEGVAHTFDVAYLFTDSASTTPSIAGAVTFSPRHGVSEPVDSVVYLSGIGYYTQNSNWDVEVADITDIFSGSAHTEHQLLLDVDGMNLTQGKVSVSNSKWNSTYDFGEVTLLDMTLDDKDNTVGLEPDGTAYNHVGEVSMAATPRDPHGAGTPVSSTPISILYSTRLTPTSSALYEGFTDENYRLQGDYATAWDSEAAPVDGHAIVTPFGMVAGNQFPSVDSNTPGAPGSASDLSAYLPDKDSAGIAHAQPDMSTFALTPVYIRKYTPADPNEAFGSMKFTIKTSGVLQNLIDSNALRLYVWKLDSIVPTSPNLTLPPAYDPADPEASKVNSIWAHKPHNFIFFDDGATQSAGNAGCNTNISGDTVTITFGGSDVKGGVLVRLETDPSVIVQSVLAEFI